MARPTIDPAKKRTGGVRVPLSPVELAKLKAKADHAEMNVTAFVRAAALGQDVIVRKSSAPDFLTRDELRRIGVNLNQIAKAMNASRDALPASLISACEKLDLLFDQWLAYDPESRSFRP